jgi:hypothetical protein
MKKEEALSTLFVSDDSPIYKAMDEKPLDRKETP